MESTATPFNRAGRGPGRRGSGPGRRPLTASVLAMATGLLSVALVLSGCGQQQLDSTNDTGSTEVTEDASSLVDVAPSSAVADADGEPVDSEPVDGQGDESAPLEIGDEFDGRCTVAWPSAPMHTSDGTQIRTTCAGMQDSGVQFVDILVLDTDLDLTPSSPTVQVHGEIVDIVESELGFTTLSVIADEVEVL